MAEIREENWNWGPWEVSGPSGWRIPPPPIANVWLRHWTNLSHYNVLDKTDTHYTKELYSILLANYICPARITGFTHNGKFESKTMLCMDINLVKANPFPLFPDFEIINQNIFGKVSAYNFLKQAESQFNSIRYIKKSLCAIRRNNHLCTQIYCPAVVHVQHVVCYEAWLAG